MLKKRTKNMIYHTNLNHNFHHRMVKINNRLNKDKKINCERFGKCKNDN